MRQIQWNKDRKKKGKYWKKKMCYYCKNDGIDDMSLHRKSCRNYLQIEKKSKRIAKQKFFGRRKKSKKKLPHKKKKLKSK